MNRPMNPRHPRIPAEAATLLDELGVPADYGTAPALPVFDEAEELTEAGPDVFDRPMSLTPEAAEAWRGMRQAAEWDGVLIQPVSGFRSIRRQAEILQAKLDRGQRLADILQVNAAPGFSEHHTGRALDITTEGCKPLEEVFEESEAFRWLCANAGRFGFRLSYPRDNPYGIAYEPWHWCFHPTQD